MKIKKSHLKQYVDPNLSDEQWGYFAGMLDAESHIRMFKVRTTSVGDNYGFEISIGQSPKNNGKELIEGFIKRLGIGHLEWKKGKGWQKNPEMGCWHFVVKQRLAIYFILKRISHLLVVKKKIADKIIAYIESTY